MNDGRSIDDGIYYLGSGRISCYDLHPCLPNVSVQTVYLHPLCEWSRADLCVMKWVEEVWRVDLWSYLCIQTCFFSWIFKCRLEESLPLSNLCIGKICVCNVYKGSRSFYCDWDVMIFPQSGSERYVEIHHVLNRSLGKTSLVHQRKQGLPIFIKSSWDLPSGCALFWIFWHLFICVVLHDWDASMLHQMIGTNL